MWGCEGYRRARHASIFHAEAQCGHLHFPTKFVHSRDTASGELLKRESYMANVRGQRGGGYMRDERNSCRLKLLAYSLAWLFAGGRMYTVQ